MHKKETTGTACPEDNGKGKDGSTSDERHDPWNDPFYPLRYPAPLLDNVTDRIKKCQRGAGINDVFNTFTIWGPILEKDSVRSFLRFLHQRNGRGMKCGNLITPETLNQLVLYNALRCAKVVLAGENPELHGFQANPNCMTQYGFFPLHRAAEMFSVNMIKLLLRHGASANLRTSGTSPIESLLPVHVAVENTCMHKYLEDSLYPNQGHLDCSHADINYVLKLIHILCLPEMKLFLDTTRLLAKHTDNLLDEVCNYIIDGKLVQAAILLLATQEQIRGVSSSQRYRNSEPDRFSIITKCVVGKITAIQLEMCQKGLELGPLEAKKKLFDITLALVHVISQAGEALDSYIQAHPKVPYVMQVPHAEVLERVSLILKDYGFCYSGEGIDIGNLCPYKNVLSSEELPHKLAQMDRMKAAVEMPYLENGMVKAKGKKEPRGWELKLARRSFFPYRRSVLTSRFIMKFDSIKELKEDINILTQSTDQASINLGKNPPLKVNYQPKRMFRTAASTLLKVLRNA